MRYRTQSVAPKRIFRTSTVHKRRQYSAFAGAKFLQKCVDGVMVSNAAFQAVDLGSISGQRIYFYHAER